MAWQNPHTWIPGSTPGAVEFNEHIRDMFNAVLPLGSLIYRVANRTAVETVVENRWLECNGVAVSRATYAALFNYLNSLTPALPFGTGDGSTTFNIPDLQGRAPWGVGTHSSVVLGQHDAAALSARSPRHHHATPWDTADGANVTWRRGAAAAGEGLIGDNTGPRDVVGYQAAGVWFIKYTA